MLPDALTICYFEKSVMMLEEKLDDSLFQSCLIYDYDFAFSIIMHGVGGDVRDAYDNMLLSTIQRSSRANSVAIVNRLIPKMEITKQVFARRLYLPELSGVFNSLQNIRVIMYLISVCQDFSSSNLILQLFYIFGDTRTF